MRILLLLLGFVVAKSLAAPKLYDPTRQQDNDFEQKKWQESKVYLPKYPKAHNLLEFKPDFQVAANFKFYLDSKSLSLGKDGVSRYTAVIKSGSATNIIFDGIRCDKAQYKNYAFGSSNRFSPTDNLAWNSVGDKSVLGLRLYLYKHVLCDDLNRAYQPKQVIKLLKYGQ